jgi:gluconate 2-dehydrogenase gamma chain
LGAGFERGGGFELTTRSNRFTGGGQRGEPLVAIGEGRNMRATVTSRRTFLKASAGGLGAAWFAANYPGIVAAQQHVSEAARLGELRGFAFFSAEQAVEVEAMTAQIIPTDETPGAREARVVAFIDRVLTTFDSERQADYAKGLEALSAKTRELFPGTARFSSLSDEQQIELLTAIEDTPFFELVRTHAITGFFASPVHGGNFDKVGWELLGYDDSLDHVPPFGYYDAQPDLVSRTEE